MRICPARRQRCLWLSIAGVLLLGGCAGRAPAAGTGGRLVAATRADPRSFNRLVSPNAVENLMTLLTQGTLVRVNRVTGVLEPRLAREWTASEDGKAWTLKLREGVQFSDGVPFTSADVLFTLKALYDPRVGSDMASGFMIDGRPITATAEGDDTIVIQFPSVYGPGLSIFDSLPILPAHKLSAALSAGTFASAWNVSVAPSDVVGLGPFLLAGYQPGRALRLTRNPHFWRRDAALPG